MKKDKIKNWILTSTTGLLLIAFGLVSILVPTITIVVLSIYFAVSIMLGGIVLSFVSFKVRNTSDRWKYLLIEGSLGILLGLAILIKPEAAAAVFVTIMGLWAILIGIIFIVHYFRRVLPLIDKTILLLLGLVSSIVGLLLVINPFEGSRTLAIIIGVYAIFYGVLSILSKHKFSVF